MTHSHSKVKSRIRSSYSYRTWKISSLWDSKEWSLSFRFLRSHSATVLGERACLKHYFWFIYIVFHNVYLVSRASCKNKLTVGVETQAVDLSRVSVNGMTCFRCVVRSSIPSEQGRQPEAWQTGASQRQHHRLLTSWVFGHRPRSQTGTRGVNARKRLLLPQYGQ